MTAPQPVPAAAATTSTAAPVQPTATDTKQPAPAGVAAASDSTLESSAPATSAPAKSEHYDAAEKYVLEAEKDGLVKARDAKFAFQPGEKATEGVVMLTVPGRLWGTNTNSASVERQKAYMDHDKAVKEARALLKTKIKEKETELKKAAKTTVVVKTDEAAKAEPKKWADKNWKERLWTPFQMLWSAVKAIAHLPVDLVYGFLGLFSSKKETSEVSENNQTQAPAAVTDVEEAAS